MCDSGRILILYGSQTFTAQEIAEKIWRTTKALGFNKGPVLAMDDYPISQLIWEEIAIFVCATTGQGDEPDNMKKFWKFLLRKNLPIDSLIKLKFGVLGLGDSTYPKFNYAGKKLHKRLMQLGASPLLDIGLCNYQHDLGHDAVMIPWLGEFYSKLKMFYPTIDMANLNTQFIPKWKVSLLKSKISSEDSNEDIYFHKNNSSDFLDVRLFEVKRNLKTTDVTHFQDVRLMTFEISDGKDINYKPGDVFNIRPRNCKEDINELFQLFEEYEIDIKPYYKLLFEQHYDDMLVPEFLKKPLTLYQIAEQYWDLKMYPSQYVFSLLALVSDDKLERDKCIELSSPEGQEDWLNYCRRPKRTVLEVLRDFHKSARNLKIDMIFELLAPIKPRSFSIASSCQPSKQKDMDLLIAVVKYYTKLKKPRLGLASNWLKTLEVGDKVYGWIKKGTFKFPVDHNIPLILVGPGTGLAAFRSLLQEREYSGTLSKHTIHLFFGCRYKEKDFHCRKELEQLESDGKLSLYCAFSRDNENKIYVQHKIMESKDTLTPLILKENAHIYISGSSKNMPDNVKDAFIEILKGSKLDGKDPKAFLIEMEDKGRLQVEAW